MVDRHEVYASAPIALVAVEVRFPDASSSGTSPLPVTLQRAFRDLLGDGWVIESMKTQRVSLSLGAGVAAQIPSQIITVPRFTIRDRTLSVAITGESLTIETTRYQNYPAFRTVLESAFGAACEVLAPDGVARVGLRYIDEIRVPGIPDDEPMRWESWVDPSLLPPRRDPVADETFRVAAWESAVQYVTGPDRKLVLRYGPRTEYAVNPVGPLKRPALPPLGPLFALDFDSFWEPQDIPEFDSFVLLATCDELRAPIRTLFDHLVTDELLSEFRKVPRNG